MEMISEFSDATFLLDARATSKKLCGTSNLLWGLSGGAEFNDSRSSKRDNTAPSPTFSLPRRYL